MEKKKTDELDELLKKTKPEEAGAYLRDNSKYLANGEKAFYYYMKDVLDEKGMKLKELYVAAGFAEGYGGKLIRMEKHAKNRDHIIRLCVAGHFKLDEINRALKLYGYSELYAKDPRDACIIIAINNRIYDLYRIDEILVQNGLDRIMEGEG
ncbi:MAG: hypothetical protein K6E50_01360 [Lachnospiraceae bacterium]|nr:hypothetical protein [Lachnospiraceae bacterium]